MLTDPYHVRRMCLAAPALHRTPPRQALTMIEARALPSNPNLEHHLTSHCVLEKWCTGSSAGSARRCAGARWWRPASQAGGARSWLLTMPKQGPSRRSTQAQALELVPSSPMGHPSFLQPAAPLPPASQPASASWLASRWRPLPPAAEPEEAARVKCPTQKIMMLQTSRIAL